MQGGRIADCQEWRFQPAKRSYMSSATEQEGRFLKLRNRVFRVRNVRIWSVPSINEFVLLILRNRVLGCESSYIGNAVL